MVEQRLLRPVRRAVRHLARTAAEPRPARPGWTTAPPDFVGVGAQRAGTSWWYGLLVDHPRIEPVAAMRRRLRPGQAPRPGQGAPAPREGSLRKELHFFDGFQARELTRQDALLYHRFFPRPAGSIAGEWTPRYMLDPWTPPLLRSAAPEAKLLVLLRDPVDRFLSGIARETRVAHEIGGDVPLAVWIDALHRSCYATQLARVLELFPADRVLVLQYERCRRDPATELRRTYEFLAVEPVDYVPSRLTDLAGRPTSQPAISATLRRELVATLGRDARHLTELVPDLDEDLWTSLRGEP